MQEPIGNLKMSIGRMLTLPVAGGNATCAGTASEKGKEGFSAF
jgi:hypothetical protein